MTEPNEGPAARADVPEERPPASTDAAGDMPDAGDDPNTSTDGLLDEEKLRAHAHEVDDAIQEARRRNA